MSTFGVQPITQHLVTFLVSCSDADLTAKQIQQAVAGALEFCVKHKGDCSVYAALLKFCVGQGIPEKAVDIWRCIRKVGSYADFSPAQSSKTKPPLLTARAAVHWWAYLLEGM